ncbi:MAG: hypothetical protein HRU70_01600 [Phycisphaeraceae bacterium]|nr:MAG: hypothetical protein HRU70_01600 [Phycisphaeraceae bacterium]
MHFVTKVFVIGATVLSVFLSALVISFSVNADRIQRDYVNEQARRLSIEDARKTEALTNAAREASLREKEQSLDSRMAGLQQRVRELEAQVAQAVASGRSIQEAADKAAALATQLGNTNEVQTQLIANLRQDADGSRVAQADTARKNAELEKALADLRRSLEAADNEKRLVREQLAEARAQIDALRAGGSVGSASAGRAADPVAFRGPAITGRVEEVSTDSSTGQMLAKISLGTNDNVRENTKLFVTRDTSFIANLVVVRSDLRWAIARVDTLGQPVSVQVGDTVKSELR